METIHPLIKETNGFEHPLSLEQHKMLGQELCNIRCDLNGIIEKLSLRPGTDRFENVLNQIIDKLDSLRTELISKATFEFPEIPAIDLVSLYY